MPVVTRGGSIVYGPVALANMNPEETATGTDATAQVVTPHRTSADAAATTGAVQQAALSLTAETTEADHGELSSSMKLILIYITQGYINAMLLLLSSSSKWYYPEWRCFLFQTTTTEEKDDAGSGVCQVQDDNIDSSIHAFVLSLLHVYVLLTCWAYGCGNELLEQRLHMIIAVLVVSNLSTGIIWYPLLSPTLAIFQGFLNTSFLLVSAYLYSSRYAHATSFDIFHANNKYSVSELRQSSFDARRQLPVATISIGIQFWLTTMELGNTMVSASSIDKSSSSSSTVPQLLQQALHVQELYMALILGCSIFLATKQQQKILNRGQVVFHLGRLLLLMFWSSQLATNSSTDQQQDTATFPADASDVGTSLATTILAGLGAF